MSGLKFQHHTGRISGVWVLIVLIPHMMPAPLRAADHPPTPPAPEISDLDKAYLLRVARRAVEASWTGDEIYEPPYVPDTLRSLFCRATVTLRRGGRLRGIGSSTRRQSVQACLTAAREAGKDPRIGDARTAESLRTMTIAIELIGEIQDLGIDLSNNAGLRDAVDPGLDGLGIGVGDRELCLTAADMIAYGLLTSSGAVTTRRHRVYPPAAWLRTREPRLRADGTPKRTAPPETLRPFRFRSTHFHEPEPQSKPVTLRRGMVLIEPDAVTADGLDRAIDAIGEYMKYRQLESGLFSYEYRPEIDQYVDANSAMRQAGSLWALTRYARWSGRDDIITSVTRGTEQFAQYALPLAGQDELLLLGSIGEANPVGLSALYALVLMEHPDDKRFADARRKFIGAMLTLRQKNGMLLDIYPPATPGNDPKAQATGPGKALLALAQWEARTRLPESPIPKYFTSALPFYQLLFREQPMASFVVWQAQAFARMAGVTHDGDQAAFVYEMVDWLAAKQLTETNCSAPELHGGIANDYPGWADHLTASYLEAFAAALALARERGEHERARRYEAVVRRAARFVLQLMVRPEECYYILSPKDMVGGVRTNPVNHHLRIDHCQHALLGLMKTREVLFGLHTAGK